LYSNYSSRNIITKQSLRVASRFAGSRAAAMKVQSRSAQTVPRLGTQAEMQAEAIQQIRARVQYQKEMVKLHAHNPAEEVAEMWRWINITFWVGVPVCALSIFYSFFFDEHPHRHEGALPDYMNVRTKEFPWECGECDLFDGKCWKKCRAEKA
jgi:cytochrome c oxidase subunit 6a